MKSAWESLNDSTEPYHYLYKRILDLQAQTSSGFGNLWGLYRTTHAVSFHILAPLVDEINVFPR